MTTLTLNRERKSPVLLLLILTLIIVFAAVASQVTERSHAVAKHGIMSAWHARNCSNNNDVFQTWYSGQRGTFAEICDYNSLSRLDDDKTWTIRIISKKTGEELTVFTHTGDIGSLEEYLIRQAYNFLK